ncbi:hypothetical protein ACXR0O_25370 [Verrucomicrobiota bacterium sgz303538]
MVIVARVIRFVVIFFFAACFLGILARGIFALDTQPDEEPVMVEIFSRSIPAHTLVGGMVYFLALLIAANNVRLDYERRRDEAEGK